MQGACEWITSLPRDDGDVVRRVATNIFQTNNARFFDLLCVGNDVLREWDLLGKKNTSVSNYHPLVSIQRRLNNESRKPFSYQTFLSKKHQIGVTSAEEVVCCCCGWCRPYRNPHHPKVSSPFTYYKDNPKMADLFMVKVYLWGRFF